LQVVLVEPEIPHNTGAIARLCLATGAGLHLVGRLGFQLDDARVRRAGLDYWEHVSITRHDDLAALASVLPPERWFFVETGGGRAYAEAAYPPDAVLIFGSESKGLPPSCLLDRAKQIFIPIADPRVRSLNLATSVAIVLFEALRQNGYGHAPSEAHAQSIGASS